MQNMVGFRPVYVEKKPKYISVFMFFLLCVVFLKYFPLLPLTIAPPRSLNRSKIFFLIIKMIQNIYCMAIYQENTSSDDELFCFFVNQELRKTRPCSFKPHHEIIFPTHIRTPPTTTICMRILVGNINREYYLDFLDNMYANICWEYFLVVCVNDRCRNR